jgi:hypothetical protein
MVRSLDYAAASCQPIISVIFERLVQEAKKDLQKTELFEPKDRDFLLALAKSRSKKQEYLFTVGQAKRIKKLFFNKKPLVYVY